MASGVSLPEWKIFVKGSDSPPNTTNPRNNIGNLESKPCLKFDARKAYEEIIEHDVRCPEEGMAGRVASAPSPLQEHAAPAPAAERYVSAKPSQPSKSIKLTLSSLMRHAERNDSKVIMEALKEDDTLINTVDQFGWSLLMVAACAGANDVVELLLLAGAHTGLRDKSGRSCVSLARKKGHHNTAKLIQNYCPSPTEPVMSQRETSIASVNIQLCPACNISIDENRKKSHITSTVHQLSECKKGCRTFYSISGSNRGYQLMLKHGWDGEKGLGPSGNGMKLPPKTTLKRDRKGIGASKGTARITHFHSNDYEAVASHSPRPLKNRVVRKQQLHQEKLLEVSLRRQLS